MGFKKQRFREVILRAFNLAMRERSQHLSECNYKRRPGNYKRPKKIEIS
jgi:hypothetical protein